MYPPPGRNVEKYKMFMLSLLFFVVPKRKEKGMSTT
jgi:hypothetical protein